MFLTIAVAVLLIAFGGTMLFLQWRAWEGARQREADAEQRDFAGRQFRRRAQMSAMLCLLGAALLGGQFIAPQRSPSLYVFYWFGVLLLALWMGLLAVADMVALRVHVNRTLRTRRLQQEQLEAELRRLTSKDRNGHATPDTGRKV